MDDCEHLNEEVLGADATFVYFRCVDCKFKWSEGR